jgi:hypothetical protein
MRQLLQAGALLNGLGFVREPRARIWVTHFTPLMLFNE